MRRGPLLSLLAVAAAALAGCAGAPPAAPGAPEGAIPPPRAEAAPAPAAAPRFAALAARLTDRAVKAERAGDLRGALESWRVVAGLRPGDAEPQRRVADLGGRLAKEAERRFRAGLALLEKGSPDAARKELVLALAADPAHAGALEALRTRLDPDVGAWTVAAGDTLEGIARTLYDDPAKAVFIARVNDLDPAAKLTPGATLIVPLLAAPAGAAAGGKGAPRAAPAAAADYPEPEDPGVETAPDRIEPEPAVAPAPAALPAAPAAPPAVAPPDPAEEQLARAEELFKARKYAEAAAAAEKAAGHARLGKRARELAAASWFASGDQALKEDRFADAAEAYRKADPDAKDVPGALAAVERRKKERAEEHYNEGVRFFINQKLAEAISSWETTLALNPQHPKAAKDVEKARALQQKLREIR